MFLISINIRYFSSFLKLKFNKRSVKSFILLYYSDIQNEMKSVKSRNQGSIFNATDLLMPKYLEKNKKLVKNGNNPRQESFKSILVHTKYDYTVLQYIKMQVLHN